MQRLPLFAFSLLVPLLAVDLSAAALTISGQVRYQANGTPVSGVTIELIGSTPARTDTDANGQYSFANVAPGSWTIQPHKSGDRRGGVRQPARRTGAPATELLLRAALPR